VPKELIGKKVSIQVQFNLAPIETTGGKLEVQLPAE
jgi:hypothetical protein